jgi:hypothetical protein
MLFNNVDDDDDDSSTEENEIEEYNYVQLSDDGETLDIFNYTNDYIIPTTVKYLNIKHFNLKENKLFPDFPDNLIELSIHNTLVTNILSLPENLKILSIVNAFELTELPKLPDNLIHLRISLCPKLKFPDYLPNSLEKIDCFEIEPPNTKILQIPDNLKYLKINKIDLSDVVISNFPIPSQLEHIQFNFCKLLELPKIPCSVYYLDIEDNNLYKLPFSKDNTYLTTLFYKNNNFDDIILDILYDGYSKNLLNLLDECFYLLK